MSYFSKFKDLRLDGFRILSEPPVSPQNGDIYIDSNSSVIITTSDIGRELTPSAYGELYMASGNTLADASGLVVIGEISNASSNIISGEFDQNGFVTRGLTDSNLVIGTDGAGLYEVHFSVSVWWGSGGDASTPSFSARIYVNGAQDCKIASLGTGVCASSGLMRFSDADTIDVETWYDGTPTLYVENYHLWITRTSK